MVEYNTIILGAGISGISCAVYLKRAGISVLIVENEIPGGQLNKIDLIENYPGYVSVSGVDLATNLMEQLSSYNIDVIHDDIKEINYDKKMVSIGNKKYSYKFLVFATGRRERMLGLENEERMIGRGISFCATCDGALYKGQDVIVVGGGNSAISEAIYLSKICNKVTLIYRGDELRGEFILKDRLLLCNNVEVIYNGVIEKYLIDDGKIVGVKLAEENACEINGSCVFLAIGHIPNSELFVGNKKDGAIIVDSFGQTSEDSVYACGDVINKEVYQLVTASNDGVLVATDIINKTQMEN